MSNMCQVLYKHGQTSQKPCQFPVSQKKNLRLRGSATYTRSHSGKAGIQPRRLGSSTCGVFLSLREMGRGAYPGAVT